MEMIEKNRGSISVPWTSWFRFVLFLASIILAWYSFKTTGYFWEKLGLGEFSSEQTYSSFQLAIILCFFANYVLTISVFVCFTAWIRKGFFNPLGSEFVIMGLIAGLLTGIVFGTLAIAIGGLVFGLIVGVYMGLGVALVGGLIIGIIGAVCI